MPFSNNILNKRQLSVKFCIWFKKIYAGYQGFTLKNTTTIMAFLTR